MRQKLPVVRICEDVISAVGAVEPGTVANAELGIVLKQTACIVRNLRSEGTAGALAHADDEVGILGIATEKEITIGREIEVFGAGHQVTIEISGRRLVTECHSRGAGADRIIHPGESCLRHRCGVQPESPGEGRGRDCAAGARHSK